MPRKRTTTSVSTLVNDIHDLRRIAKMAGRKDLLKEFNLLAVDISKLAEDYEYLRSMVTHYNRTMERNAIDDSDLEETLEETEEVETETEEVVEEVVEEVE